MAKPIVGDFVQEWYDTHAPLQFDEVLVDYALLKFMNAMGFTFEEINDLVRDTDAGPGWSVLLDADRAPAKALPWLAQFAGIELGQELTEDQRRQRILDTPTWNRGSVGSIRAAAQTFLTGSKTVVVRERNGGAYRLTVITYTDETPDPVATEAAIRSQKPAGIVLNYIVEDGQDYQTLLDNYPTYADVDAAYDTYQDVLDDTP